jgi:hypothetical protein
VDSNTGDGRWVFESADPETRDINATDKRFFWMALYVQPVLWVVLAIVALFGWNFIWLTLVGESTLVREGGWRVVGMRMEWKANMKQLSHSYLRSRIRLLSPAATSSARLVALLRTLYTAPVSRGTSQVAWSAIGSDEVANRKPKAYAAWYDTRRKTDHLL